MSENYDVLKQHPQRKLEKVYNSYRSIVRPQNETGKMLLHDSYVLQKVEEKVVRRKNSKRTKEEILQRNRDGMRKWRMINREEYNASRRFEYAKNAIESGREYIPKEDRIRFAKTQKRQRESKQDGYYTKASRHERRVQKSINTGKSREDAIEEANEHFKKLKAWQRKKHS